MSHLGFLTAGYSAVWVVLATYLVMLYRKNKQLQADMAILEERLSVLEKETD